MKQDNARSIALIASGMAEAHLRLQPWRYLHEVARQLQAHGHRVTLISDGAPELPDEGLLGSVPVRRLETVANTRWRGNRALEAAIERCAPELLLWHVGLTSFAHQRVGGWRGVPTVGIFTSPIYNAGELARPGLRRMLRGHRLSATHVLGMFAPNLLLRRALGAGRPERLVVQSVATYRRLLDLGLRPGQVDVITPGVDPAWSAQVDARATRAALGYGPNDTVALYFGSPAPLRGLHTLIYALEIARRADPSLKLLVLSRRHAEELAREDAELGRLLDTNALGRYVRVVSGYLPEPALVQHVMAADLVALPFDLLPSDAPLSLLEAQALGKPVVTTNLGCLPELVERGPRYLARPADPQALAQALIQAAADLRARPADNAAPRPPARSWQQMGAEWSLLVQQRARA